MGGIDFLDRMISYYRISVRTRKWTVRVIMHMFDFAISASWIEYRRNQRLLGTKRKDIMNLSRFKEEYAHFVAHGHKENSEDSDYNFECSFSPPRKQPRVSPPPLPTYSVRNILCIYQKSRHRPRRIDAVCRAV